MFAITVKTEFCAAHALSVAGVEEPIHGHNFRVHLTLEGPELDSDGLLCDFHTIEDALEQLLAPFQNANLSDHPPFDTTNASAEAIAHHIAEHMHIRVGEALAPHARIASVSVSEAPGCVATYRPPLPSAASVPSS